MRNERYGEVGVELFNRQLAIEYLSDLGQRAEEYVELTSHPDAETPEWSHLGEDDRMHYAYKLDCLIELERYFASPEWGRDLSYEAQATLHSAIDRYHDTLPFTGAERRWFIGAYYEADESPEGGDPLTSVQALGGMSDKIIDAGHEKVVGGDAVIRRWWDWWRDVGEYEDTGAHQRTLEALTDLAGLLRAPGDSHG